MKWLETLILIRKLIIRLILVSANLKNASNSISIDLFAAYLRDLISL